MTDNSRRVNMRCNQLTALHIYSCSQKHILYQSCNQASRVHSASVHCDPLACLMIWHLARWMSPPVTSEWVCVYAYLPHLPLNYCVTSTWWVMLERGTNIWLLGERKKSKIAALERGGDGSQCLALKVKQMSLYITITDSDAHQQKLPDLCLK